MRDADERGCGLFSYVDLEARVPADHPLRAIRVLVDEALAALSPDFAGLYSKTGRPSLAPEKLLRALLLQAFYTIRRTEGANYLIKGRFSLPHSATGGRKVQPSVPSVATATGRIRCPGPTSPTPA